MIKSKTSLLSRYLTNARLVSVLFLSVSLFWQCISPPDFVGGDLLPDQDLLKVKTDTTFQLSGYTVPYDSLNSTFYKNSILGETYDPIFGRTQSSFLTQLILAKIKGSFKPKTVVDSAFLFLQLTSKLGNEPIGLSVFELKDSLVYDSLYNALEPNIDHRLLPLEIGTSVTPYNGDSKTLKIPISTDWLYNRIIAPVIEDSTLIFSQKNFLKFFYGIYVKPKTTFSSHAKGLYYFSNADTQSKMTFYYRDSIESDSVLTFSMVFSDYNMRYNHFKHNFNAVDPTIGLKFNAPELTQDSVFYVKGLGSARGVIVLDGIVSWLNKMPVSINRAELRIEQENHIGMPKDTLLNSLFAYSMDGFTKNQLLDQLANESTFGGYYSKSKKYYSLNITYHLQYLLKNPEKDNKIYIEPRDFSQNANGAVLRSGSHSRKMKLIITYTKL
jgi:hypothetical protein